MTEPGEFIGFLSLPAEIQEACMAEPEPSDRIRIEIVADILGREVQIDYEADMAYFEVRKHDGVAWSDIKQEDESLIVDYDENDELLGIEVFLVQAAVRPVTVAALTRLLKGK